MKGGYEGSIKMHNSKQFFGNSPLQSRLIRSEAGAMKGASFMARGPGYASYSLLVLWIIASIALPAVAQQGIPSTTPSAPTPAGPTDEFDRGVPRSAMLSFL
jgi:hypothetical protein